MKKLSAKISASALLLSTLVACESKSDMNVVYILVDDLGYGDLGCYGQKLIATPNIDAMASEGMRFTQHYSGSTVSAPSRCVLMTGLHTGHSQVKGNKEVKPEGQEPMRANTYTLAKMFDNEGYATGLFGKWGLGYPGSESEPNKAGFDEFYGYNCQRKAHSFYPPYLWDNNQKVSIEGNQNGERNTFSQDLIHQRGLEFIRSNKDRPFFAMLTYTLPHAELAHPNDATFQHYDSLFNEEPKKLAPYSGAGYYPCAKPHATFAAMVSTLDRYVGEVLSELKKQGIADNTIVIFTSDNGAHREGGADPQFFDSNGPLRGLKRDLYEGGIRVPMVAWSPSNIPAGVVSDHISAFWDVMPTFAQMLDVELPIDSDGISFLPTLTASGTQQYHPYLYWQFEENSPRKRALRDGDWKFICFDKGSDRTVELYNLKDDVGEESNLAKVHPEKVRQYLELLDEAAK